MRVKLDWLPEPYLRFRNGVTGWEPKAALAKSVPSAGRTSELVQLGLVALPDQLEAVLAWFRRLEGLIVSNESNARRFREFPGTRRVLDCKYDVPNQFIRQIDCDAYARLAALAPNDRFEPLLNLFFELRLGDAG